MEKYEILLNAISQLYFFEEMRLRDICYIRQEDTDPCRPDLVVNLENCLIALKLEIRGNHVPAQGEDHWIDETFASGRIEMLETLRQIRESTLSGYVNHKGEQLQLRKGHISAFPVLVLDNGELEQAYPKLLENYTPNGVIVNCMMLPAFRRICGTLSAPMEFMHFLYYRAAFYGDVKTVTRSFPDAINADGSIRPVNDVELVYKFLAETYGYYKTNIQRFHLDGFGEILRRIPGAAVISRQGKTGEDALRFLSHFSRAEISAFMDRIDMLKDEAGRGAGGLLSTLRPKDDQYAVFFVAKDPFPLDALRSTLYGSGRLKDIMEVVASRQTDGEIRFRFMLEDLF